MNSYENGGLNDLDFATLKNKCKVNWIKQIVRNPNSIWCFIFSHILSKFGGLFFFLAVIIIFTFINLTFSNI